VFLLVFKFSLLVLLRQSVNLTHAQNLLLKIEVLCLSSKLARTMVWLSTSWLGNRTRIPRVYPGTNSATLSRNL